LDNNFLEKFLPEGRHFVIKIRRASDRGSADYGWLQTSHTFSFADYYDPNYMGFRSLRVINEDYIAVGGGFPTHGHRDMEIITYVTQGALEHRDTLGNRAQIKPGMIQKMSAGSGIRHSEFNASSNQTTRLFQIWIEPNQRSITPSYGEKSFAEEIKSDNLVLLASPDGRLGSMVMQQDVQLWVCKSKEPKELSYQIDSGRYAWIQIVEGSITINGEQLLKSDGAAISGETKFDLKLTADSEFLLFDLA
jgi:redox-sensitive bicupin YhaK (pirin superfamily)